MPWKIHRENTVPIGGTLPGAHIIPELPPLLTVETQEEAKEVMTRLIAQGVRPGDLYAVGYDYPSADLPDA
jgi:hypothetical protein